MKKVLALAISLLLAILTGEVYCRFLVKPSPVYPLIWDEDLGWLGRPNSQGWNQESKLFTKKSSEGWHDFSIEKDSPKRCTVNLFGDSMAEGIQVAEKDTFASLIESQKPICRNMRVNNFGVSSFGPLQELRLFEAKSVSFPATITIVSIFLGNDFDNLIAENNLKNYPQYKISDGTIEIIENTHRPSDFRKSFSLLAGTIGDQSALFATVIEAMQKTRSSLRDENKTPSQPNNAETHKSVNYEKYRLLAMKETLIRFQELANLRNTNLIFLVIPTPTRATIIERKESMTREKFVLRLCEEMDFNCLSLTRFWADRKLTRKDTNGFFFGGVGHLTPLGHLSVAELLTNSLNRMKDQT